MSEPVAEHYDARWGYRHFDAERYERRRYGSLGRRINLWLTERALARALATVPAGGLVLDAPCGTGILSAFLRQRGLRVIGADISPAMLSVARRRGAALGHVRADLEQPPCRAGSVDAVLSSRFMMHLPPDTRTRVFRAMAELARGPVVATVCHPYTWKSFQRAVRRMLGGKAKRSPRLTRRELAREAASAGLRVERVIPVLPVLSEVWVVVLRTLPRPS
jgi:SAM-dependent methyltransferase